MPFSFLRRKKREKNNNFIVEFQILPLLDISRNVKNVITNDKEGK